MSGDVRSGASIQRIRQIKAKASKQQIAVTNRTSFQNCPSLVPGRLDLTTPSAGQLRTIMTFAIITWKPPDISSLHNVTFNRHMLESTCKLFFPIKVSPSIGAPDARRRPHPHKWRPEGEYRKHFKISATAHPQASLQNSRYGREHKQASSIRKANGGAKRDRTADPLLAKQVLSQLSYSPNLKLPSTIPQKWWARADSNCRPHAYQACALTT